MNLNERFSRSTVFWVLLVQVAAFIPHVKEMPIWVSVLYCACLVWRFGVYQGRWDFPNLGVRIFLVLCAFLAVLVSYRTINGAHGGIALLIIAFGYKALEMKERRDAYVTVILAYFVVASAFLFQRSILVAMYSLFSFALVSAALVSMNRVPSTKVDAQGLKRAVMILLQSIPVMVFLFLFFPKLPPLFQIKLGSENAKTGLSESLSPGSISKLTQSAELAFRAKFTDKRPDHRSLYWRAQIFEEFDGITWSMSKKKPASKEYVEQLKLATNEEGALAYEIYQESSGQKMMFSIPSAWSNDIGVKVMSDGTLERHRSINQLIHYQVRTKLDMPRGLEISDGVKALNLGLPVYGNERALEFAKDMRRKYPDDASFVSAILLNYQTDEYYYTLEPPRLGANPISEFLLDTKKGFCEHYASSFVFLMRAGGIPARVIGGYMGGEYNERGGYLLVHQFDAHAWAEIWQEGKGWLRVDPTAYVAPNRINGGIEEALENGERILSDSFLSSRRYRALQALRLRLDFVNLQWDQWVLGYNKDMQNLLLEKVLGKVNSTRIAIFMITCFFAVVLSSALFMYLSDLFRVRDPVDRMYIRFQKKLKKHEIEREASETPEAFARRVSTEKHELSESVLLFTEIYMRLKYQGAGQLDAERRQQKSQLSKVLSTI